MPKKVELKQRRFYPFDSMKLLILFISKNASGSYASSS